MEFLSLRKFGLLRIACVTMENKIADVEYNLNEIVQCIRRAKEKDCFFLVFPELCLTSYTCGDLFYQKILADKVLHSIVKLKQETKKYGTTIVVGMPLMADSRLFNCAAFISNGSIKGIVPKTYLPNTNEFYEERWFASEFDRISNTIRIDGEDVPFGADLIFELDGTPDCKIGIEICEDLWAVIPPSSDLAINGANVILNLSASDEYLGKSEYRRNLVLSQSAKCHAAYIYSSTGPGESSTDLVFSGHSIIAENGSLLSETERFRFETDIAYADVDFERMNTERQKNNSFSKSSTTKKFRTIQFNLPKVRITDIKRFINPNPFVSPDEKKRSETCEEIFKLQSTALAKRMKAINLNNIVLGLSGGLDSTLALLVAYKTFKLLGYDKSGIHNIIMPGFGTTNRTKSNAIRLAELLEVPYRIISIDKAVKQHFEDIGHDENDHSIVYENAQARERTQILMDVSNQVCGIVLGTGDLSEIALGWSTYNADHISMYNVNCGVPKTLVKYVIEWCADVEFDGEIAQVLKDICSTPISPELLPAKQNGEIAQETEKALGPYVLHDFFLYHFFRFHFSPKKLFIFAQQAFKEMYEPEEILKWMSVFYKRFFRYQFKRTCIPDGPKIGTVALSPRGDWRMPTDAEVTLWLAEIKEIKENLEQY